MFGCFSASVAVDLDPAVRGGSRLACQRRLWVEENSWGMVAALRGSEYLWWGLLSGLRHACKDAARLSFPLAFEACEPRSRSLLARGGYLAAFAQGR